VLFSHILSQRSVLTDFNLKHGHGVEPTTAAEETVDQDAQNYNPQQYWNYLDDQLAGIREKAAQQCRTKAEEKAWLAK
jgi:hypothetical protein